MLMINCIEPTSTDLSQQYIADATAFVERLVSCLFAAKSLGDTRLSNSLALNCFAVLLEASLHCRSVWKHFQITGQCTALLRGILLEDARWEIREGAADRLRGIFSVLPT